MCSPQSTYYRFLTFPSPTPQLNFAAFGERLIRLMGRIGSLKSKSKVVDTQKVEKDEPKPNDKTCF